MFLMDYPYIRREDISDFYQKSTCNLLHAYIDAHSQILIDECPLYGVQEIPRLQSQCSNMKFSYQSRYNRLSQHVVHGGWDSSINYIKIFHNAKALVISVVNIYTEDQLMLTCLNKLYQVGEYSSKIASHQSELSGEEKIFDQKSLSISDLQIDYLNLDNSVRNNDRRVLINQGAVTVEVHTQLRNYLSNRKNKNAIRNHPSIHATLIIKIMNVKVANKISALDVD